MTQFNPSGIDGIYLESGRYLKASNTKAIALEYEGKPVEGLRFTTVHEGRELQAFVPFASIAGHTGIVEGEPKATEVVTLDVASLTGAFLTGGRFLKVLSAEVVPGVFGGSRSIEFNTLQDNTSVKVAVSINNIVGFTGDFRTDDERAEDKAKPYRMTDAELDEFIATYQCTPDQYAKAAAKQTKAGVLKCAACGDPITAPYEIAHYVEGKGLVHGNLDLECSPFVPMMRARAGRAAVMSRGR